MKDLYLWFKEHPLPLWWLKTTFYLLIVFIAIVFARKFIRKILNTEGKDHRKKTVFPIFKEVLYGLIYFFAFCIVLEIFGVSTTPIWTIASAMSVAIGFGAQQILKDVFSGFLILLEGQYVVGDTVEINGDTGEVEVITLRTTQLRDGVNGSVYIISNGEIRTVTNLSRQYMIAVVDLPIPYDCDLDQTLDEIRKIADSYPNRNPLLEKIAVLGVRDFDVRNLVVRVTCKTKSGKNWSVERDLRRYFKNELEKIGIHLPHMNVYVREVKESTDES